MTELNKKYFNGIQIEMRSVFSGVRDRLDENSGCDCYCTSAGESRSSSHVISGV